MAPAGDKDTKGKTDERLIVLSVADNVAVARQPVDEGEIIELAGAMVRVSSFIGIGHKIALRDIAAGKKILKYGIPVGSATAEISAGEHVHLHNLKSDYTATHFLAHSRAHSLAQARFQHESATAEDR